MWVTAEKEEESCEFIRNLCLKGGKIAWFCSQASLGQKPATGPCLVNLLIDSLMNITICVSEQNMKYWYIFVTELAFISLKVLDI